MPKIILTSPKTGKTVTLTPPVKTPTAPPGYKGIDIYHLASSLPVQKATAHHPDMQPDGGLNTYGLTPKTT